jgi:hypothetical protein
MIRWAICSARRAGAALVLALTSAHAAAQAPSEQAQQAFKLCDARTFVALNLARIYLREGRDAEATLAPVKDSDWGRATVKELIRRVDAGELRHPAEFAADVLYQCAIRERLAVGRSKVTAQVCLARSDIAYELHAHRVQGLVRQEAIARTTQRLTPRELYPTGLVNVVAEAVYAPAQPPDLRALASQVLWGCIRSAPRAASAASR